MRDSIVGEQLVNPARSNRARKMCFMMIFFSSYEPIGVESCLLMLWDCFSLMVRPFKFPIAARLLADVHPSLQTFVLILTRVSKPIRRRRLRAGSAVSPCHLCPPPSRSCLRSSRPSSCEREADLHVGLLAEEKLAHLPTPSLAMVSTDVSRLSDYFGSVK